MALAQSKLTAQGQISVPVEIRRKLGIGPGALLQWDEENGEIVVRRVGQYSSEDIHRAVFAARQVTPKSLDELKDGVWSHVKARHARR